MDNYEKLHLYHKKHGHCRVPQSAKGGDRSFGLWVAKQKRKYSNFKAGCKKDSLTAKQATLLDELGFARETAKANTTSSAASQVVDAVMEIVR